jgi:ubiquinone/menaquinone biosynthesis C-methylase UbiE
MRTKQEAAVEEMFDQLSENYLSGRQIPEIAHEREVILRSISGAHRYKRILDIGCGPGTFFEGLSNIGQEIYGIDISEKMIKVAQERLRDNPEKNRVHFKIGNAEKLDYPDSYFSAILAVGVLRYMSSWECALSEAYRSLERGGVFVCTFFYRFSPQWLSTVLFYRPLLPIISLLKGRSIKSLLLHIESEPLPFSYRRCLRTLSTLGFRNIETSHSGFTYFPVDKLFPTLSSRLAVRLGSMFRDSQILGWLGSVCIVKATK